MGGGQSKRLHNILLLLYLYFQYFTDTAKNTDKCLLLQSFLMIFKAGAGPAAKHPDDTFPAFSC